MIDTESIKTEFHVECVRVGKLEKHPNADTLSITEVNGYPVIVKSGSFQEGDLAVYVPVDSVVPTSRDEFAFLGQHKATSRIRAARLRGIFSMGLLVPAPTGSEEGQDMAAAMGVTKYVSPNELKLEAHEARQQHAINARKDKVKLPVYGLDPMRRNKGVLEYGEEVVITEKIHGCNARYCYEKGRLHVGSHKVMRGASPTRFGDWLERMKLKLLDLFGIHHRAHTLQAAGDVWWQIAERYQLRNKLEKQPGYVLYGEIYGQAVQELTYDSPEGRKFLAFDVYDMATGKFLDYNEFVDFITEIGLDEVVDVVPTLYRGPWTPEVEAEFKKWADTGKSRLNEKQITEGYVVKPVVERFDRRVGRVALKYVGEGYLLQKKPE